MNCAVAPYQFQKIDLSMESQSIQDSSKLLSIASLTGVAWLVALWIAYRITIALYNISPYHPLSRFPGPKIAAASYLYEAYYDWWLVGRYGKVIARMHEKYGPIVRINPDELHCSDPDFTDEIYAGPGRVRNKWQHQLNTGGAGPVSVTGFSTVNHDLHRARRAPLSKFFSRQQMLKLEGEVHDFAQQTMNKMLASAGKGVFDVKEAFNCFTADVISQYAFGEPMGFIAQEGWEPNFATWVKSFFKSAYMMRHNALGRKMAQVMPLMADYLGDDIKSVMRQMNVVIPGYINQAAKNPQNGRVFADLVESKSRPENETMEETMYRLNGEGFNFLLAGTETTAVSLPLSLTHEANDILQAILTVFTYWVLAKPEVYDRLMKDLEGLNARNMKWVELEKRPYFWAILQECLRMMPGVSHRSARAAPQEELVYKSQDGKTTYVIPRNTPIGMTSMINHWNKDLFPNPDEFTPERWLIEGQPNYQLQKKLIAFGKGSRSCIGEK